MSEYREVVAKGVDPREVASFSVHGWDDGAGNTIGIIFEHQYASAHHVPTETRFLRDEGFEARDYFCHCVGMGVNGIIGEFAVVPPDDGEEGYEEPEGGGEPESDGEPEGGEAY